MAAYLHRQGISVIPYLDDWLIHHPDHQVLLRHRFQLVNILNMVGLRLNEAKSKLEPVQDIQFLGLQLHLDQGRASLPISKAREIMAQSCRISSQKILLYKEVSQLMGSLNWASGLIPLGRLHLRPLQRHFHSLGLTSRFSPPGGSDPPVLATLLRQWQDLSFLTSGIPIQPYQAEFTIFMYVSTQGWGAHMGDSQIAGVWTRAECGLHINVLELKAVIFALHHWAAILQGHHVLITTDNTTVVAYINKQGGTHSHRLLRLVVDLFLWLQTQDITLRARHIPGCLSVIADRLSQHDRVESPP